MMAADLAHDIPLHSVGLLWPVAVSFGGGLNSTALLVKWVLDGNHPPDRIIFADTGGERPETYDHLAAFSDWLVAQGLPAVEVTRKGGRQETLEEYSLRSRTLPSLAYGHKGCSWKFKIEPQERDINRWPMAKRFWKMGDKVVKLIGYGAEEQKRISKAKLEDDKYFYRFPLDEWGLDRSGCEAVIRHVGLTPPPKSSCFFCPSTKKAEILALPAELKQRAIWIERTAQEAGNLKTVKGLGRGFAWSEFLAGAEVPEAQLDSCMYCADESSDFAKTERPVFTSDGASCTRT
jgi:hypothetical protein